jgi:cytochrome c553
MPARADKFWGLSLRHISMLARHLFARFTQSPLALALALFAVSPAFAAGNAKDGEAKAAVCAACHMQDGNSSDPQYPKIAGQHEQYMVRHLKLFKSGERNNAVMLGFATPLSEQDMHDIGAFYATKAATPGVADEKLVELGRKVFHSGNPVTGVPACMACHGPAGRGNPASGYPAIGGQHANYTQTQLEAFKGGLVHGTGANANAVMATIAKNLSKDEIVAVSSYLEGLRTAPAVELKSPIEAGRE